MIIFSINPQKSNTLGGVESLIRQLHNLKNVTNFYEFYEHERNYEYTIENEKVNYIKFGFDKKTLKNKVLTKLSLFTRLKETKVSPDFIFIYHPNDLLYIPSNILKKTKVILVQTNKFNIFFKGISKYLIKLNYKSIWSFTVYTELDKFVLNKFIPKLSPVTKVIPRGCKLDTSEIPIKIGKKLVTICRIDNHQKNFTAMNDILTNLPCDYTLDIYGDGIPSEVAKLKSIISKNNKIRFMGPTNDVQSILKQYSLFIMTSNYEGFGQSLIEARSQGLPIVAYNTFDALSWIVDNKVNGYTVLPNDTETFIDNICTITNDERIFNDMSIQALKKAQETDSKIVKILWERLLND